MQKTTQTPALAAILALMLAPLTAHAGQGADKDHGHDHAHSHTHGDAAHKTVAKGYFDDAQIAPRALSDWQGEWQSVYPLLLDGTLDGVMAHKAQHGDKTAAEYAAYYKTGYATDVDRITIAGDRVSFSRNGKAVSARYAQDGYEILTYEKGNRGVRFVFQKTEGDAEAPRFIQFSDHKIAPEAADHYHLYWGDDRAALLAELTNWPTYYPATLSPQHVADEMMAH